MGGSPSRPPPPPPPVVTHDPRPARPPLEGLSIGTSQGCKNGSCVLGIAQGISASSVRMYRQFGDISREECELLGIDTQKVKDNKMSIDEYKANLTAGKYYDKQENGYCGQIVISEEDIKTARKISDIDTNKFRKPKIRKMTDSGGFSSLTKVILKPSIPFKIIWDGQEVTVDTMTLFHPSPIRIENVQHDAMLTLNDPADTNTRLVILVPLKGAVIPGKSGDFIAKIASYLPGVLSPNPATGLYESIDVPTGSDWNLSKLFTGKPVNGSTVVTSGLYVWNALPLMEEYIKTQSASLIAYGWRPASGSQRPAYVMLDQASTVSSFDLQTIRMLPVTDSGDAIDVPAKDSISYRPGDCAATSASTTPATPPASSREQFSLDEGADACDPFANMPPTGPDPQVFVTILLSIVSAMAIFIGIYFAMKYVTTWKGDIFKMAGEFLGKQVAQLSKMKPKGAPIVSPKDRTALASLAEATGAADIDTPEPESKKEEDTTFSVDNPLIPKEKRDFIEKKIAEKKKKEEDKIAEEKKNEEDKKKKEEERKKEEEESAFSVDNPLIPKEKRDFIEKKLAEKKKKEEEKLAEEKRKEEEKLAEEEKKKEEEKLAEEKRKEEEKLAEEEKKKEDRIKYLKTTPDITKAEQTELQKLTGEVRPTKQEQKEAAGTGLFSYTSEGKPIKKRKIAVEPTDEEQEEQDKLRLLKSKLEKAEAIRKEELAKHELKIAKEKEELVRKEEEAKRQLEIAKEKETEAKLKRQKASRTLPAVPPPLIEKEKEAKKEVINATINKEQAARDLANAIAEWKISSASYAKGQFGFGRTRRRIV